MHGNCCSTWSLRSWRSNSKRYPYMMDMLPWIGLVIGGVAIAAVLATKFLVHKMSYATVTAAH